MSYNEIFEEICQKEVNELLKQSDYLLIETPQLIPLDDLQFSNKASQNKLLYHLKKSKEKDFNVHILKGVNHNTDIYKSEYKGTFLSFFFCEKGTIKVLGYIGGNIKSRLDNQDLSTMRDEYKISSVIKDKDWKFPLMKKGYEIISKELGCWVVSDKKMTKYAMKIWGGWLNNPLKYNIKNVKVIDIRTGKETIEFPFGSEEKFQRFIIKIKW